MANHSATKKSIRKTETRTENNRAEMSAIRTAMRKVREATAEKNKDAATAAFQAMESLLMRGTRKGLFHKNKMSRTLSRISKHMKAMG
jgi:small subunit ribosomal protein S20